MNAPLVIVQTTLARNTDAEKLASELIQKRLAACVQMTPIKSLYRWEGKVQSDEEIRLDIKSSAARKEALLMALQELHPYEEPEILVITVDEASEGYAKWVEGETSAPIG